MADINAIVENLSGLTVLEVADLVRQLEEKWGVAAAAPVAVDAVPRADGDVAAGVPAKNVVNLALSAGGVRSASFALGTILALSEKSESQAPVLLDAKLEIRVDKDLGGMEASVPATIRVQHGKKIWKKQTMIAAGRSAIPSTVDVPAGIFTVEVSFPSGTRVSTGGEAERGVTVPVELRPDESRHEWLAWSSFAADRRYSRISRPLARGIASAASAVESVGSDSGSHVTPLKPLIRFWKQNEDRKWEPADAAADPWGGTDVSIASFQVTAPFARRTDYLLAEVWVGPDSPREYCAVPATWFGDDGRRSSVLLTVDSLALHEGNSQAKARPATVRVTVLDSDYAQLTGYLVHGDLASLKVVNEQFSSRAEQLLDEKRSAPHLASAAALALLKTQQLDLLHDWTANLAQWFPEFPDASIIRAWHILYAKEKAFLRPGETALGYLRNAAQRGLPLFAESMRLLVDGLRLFSQTESDLRPLLAEYEKFLWSMDAGEPFTSFSTTQGLLEFAPAPSPSLRARML